MFQSAPLKFQTIQRVMSLARTYGYPETLCSAKLMLRYSRSQIDKRGSVCEDVSLKNYKKLSICCLLSNHTYKTVDFVTIDFSLTNI